MPAWSTFTTRTATIRPGVRVVRTGGHCPQHQIVFVESAGRTAVFTADLIPTTAHIRDAWIMGYDLFPMETLAFKKRFIRDAIDREYLIFFEHDPLVAAGYIREKDGRALRRSSAINKDPWTTFRSESLVAAACTTWMPSPIDKR